MIHENLLLIIIRTKNLRIFLITSFNIHKKLKLFESILKKVDLLQKEKYQKLFFLKIHCDIVDEMLEHTTIMN